MRPPHSRQGRPGGRANSLRESRGPGRVRERGRSSSSSSSSSSTWRNSFSVPHPAQTVASVLSDVLRTVSRPPQSAQVRPGTPASLPSADPASPSSDAGSPAGADVPGAPGAPRPFTRRRTPPQEGQIPFRNWSDVSTSVTSASQAGQVVVIAGMPRRTCQPNSWAYPVRSRICRMVDRAGRTPKGGNRSGAGRHGLGEPARPSWERTSLLHHPRISEGRRP